MAEQLSTEVHTLEEDDSIARGMHVARAVGERWGRLRTQIRMEGTVLAGGKLSWFFWGFLYCHFHDLFIY